LLCDMRGQGPKQVIKDMNSMLELYSTYQLVEYDYYNYKNQVTFSLFVENLEQKAQKLEERVIQIQ
jgi:hypothetical protein